MAERKTPHKYASNGFIIQNASFVMANGVSIVGAKTLRGGRLHIFLTFKKLPMLLYCM